MTWVEEEASGNDHRFDEMHVQGAAHVAFKTEDDQTDLSVFVGYLYGDFTGGLGIGDWYEGSLKTEPSWRHHFGTDCKINKIHRNVRDKHL